MTNPIFAQTEVNPCELPPPTFEGTPQTTLCDEYEQSSYSLEIGVGTSFTYSSQLTGTLPTNIWIKGDFYVDDNFKFENNIIKIEPGVTIHVLTTTMFKRILTIKNSKLFACDELWKGIKLNNGTGVFTSDGSIIEDAEAAIHAINTSNAKLSIKNTTFNRNVIGIQLENGPTDSHPPVIFQFADNIFNCDAPLNGTTNEVSYAGMKLVNVPAAFFPSTIVASDNRFYDLQYGIRAEGLSTTLAGRFFNFYRMKYDGIYMDQGNLSLTRSRFENCENFGINLQFAEIVSLSDHCTFTFDETLSDPGSPYIKRYGLHIGSTGFGSNIFVSNSTFFANLTNPNKTVGGIYIGGDIGGLTEVKILESGFNITAEFSWGILIDGEFPSQSQIDIAANVFDIETSGSTSYGIICQNGNKYDMDIIVNEFYNDRGLFDYWPIGIHITGSEEGIGNQIDDNNFLPGEYLNSYSVGVDVQNFDKTTFCGNTFADAARSFNFLGLNDGASVSSNTAYGAQIVRIGSASWIDNQSHQGNKWTLFSSSDAQVVIQAECVSENYAQYSEFHVHTPQSTSTDLADPGFSPYHPFTIVPDDPIVEWWIEDPNGTPVTTCLNEIISNDGEDTKLKRDIAEGDLAAVVDDPSIVWQAEKSLYFTLKRDSALAASNSSYTSFLSAKANSNIDKFYQVASAVDAARTASTSASTNIESNRLAIENIVQQLEIADEALTEAVGSTAIDAAEATKIQLLDSLMSLEDARIALNNSYKQNLVSALTAAEQINNDITSATDLESYEKTVNTIFIDFLQTGIITQSQSEQLEEIAVLCPREGGMAVYKARGLLPECVKTRITDNYSECYPAPTPPDVVEERSDKNLQGTITISSDIFPNPAGNSVTITVPDGSIGNVLFFNSFGVVKIEESIKGASNGIDLSRLQPGVYTVSILLSDGQHCNKKLVVLK